MPAPLSIYIHWPFCKSKCPYCDFNSHVRADIDDARWQKALRGELAYYAKILPGRQVVSVFFGGGTPSLMRPGTVAALLESLSGLWQVAEDVEITLEANPTSVEAEKFKAFRLAGVNRVSIGVQALRAIDLKFLGREHDTEEALHALALARDIFPRMSFDLIYARPDQTLAAWEAELNEALKYARDHVSLYQLTIEENTAFHHLYHKGGFALPEDGLAADMYALTQDITEAHGLPAYEVSNHAKPGQESRHNLAYWRSEDYIGIGAGAHGRYRLLSGGAPPPSALRADSPAGSSCSTPPRTHALTARIATENIKSPERWLESVERLGNGLSAEAVVMAKESLEEAIMMGLRLASGIRYGDWETRLGFNIRDALSPATLRKLRDMSLITADDRHIAATKQGRLLLNSITRELLTHFAAHN
jgi:oxygen-independent coproporphyrinogen-3 oxidase